jgi:DNA-directed RNA polymerase II subunit RPB2
MNDFNESRRKCLDEKGISARDGGLRLGTMERDAVIAHGMAKFLKERLMDVSDAYSTYVCGKCGLFARRKEKNKNKRIPTKTDVFYCPSCDNNTNDIHKIMIPYAFKLMVQELMAMTIAPRIRVQKELQI